MASHQAGVLHQQHGQRDAHGHRPGELERGDARYRELQRPGAHERLGDEQHGREQERHRHVLRHRYGEQ